MTPCDLVERLQRFGEDNASICWDNPEDHNEVLTALSVTLAVRQVL